MPFQFRKEAIEEDLNSNFPSQGQGNPPLYYSLSEVVVPTYSINDVAEGTSLPENLQTAWDFGTGTTSVNNATSNVITNTGFWRVRVSGYVNFSTAGGQGITVALTDGLSTKNIWTLNDTPNSASADQIVDSVDFVIFVNTGITVTATATDNAEINLFYRQIADINGNLVNPLGFSFA